MINIECPTTPTIKGNLWQEPSNFTGFQRTAGASPPAPSRRAESDLQMKWELHLATAVSGLYVATHRGVQLGVGLASDAVRHQGRGHGRPPRIRTPAIAYLRTSSAANVGADKGSDKRQRDAIAAHAKHAGFAVVDTYYDAAVSGADPIETRPGFLALLDRIEGDGVRTVLIEDASRVARELITQELGILSLIKRGVRVLTAAGDDLTATDGPFKKAMRQIAGAFAELEKARLVAKLRHARERIRSERGKCEGRKTRIERATRENNPELVKALRAAVEMARRLRRASPKTGERRSLRKISAEPLRPATSTNVASRSIPTASN